jgi:D-glycero-beta-D-manno-heptose-7-phosphate kinase
MNLDNFNGKRILIIGDIMLDKYIWGSIERMSPEAPVKIVDVAKETYILGGAANTANNIISLGGKATLIGTIGADESGKIISKLLDEKAIEKEIIIDTNKPTIQKTRIMSNNQQQMRVDYESKKNITKEIEDQVLDKIKQNIEKADAIIISDYMKGNITERLITEISNYEKIVVVDPKSRRIYKNVTLITPNNKEICKMFNLECTNGEKINELGINLLKEINSNILVTRGEKGATLFEKDGSITDIPTKAVEVYDVSGAGDTVTAAVTLALASGANLKEAAEIANHAAGVVVGKLGTTPCTIEELKSSF